MLVYQLFPRSFGMNETIMNVIRCFELHYGKIDSSCHSIDSNEVLKIIAPELKLNGFIVEESKKTEDKIKVPVLFGLNNHEEKYFDADAVSIDGRYVIEVEAGRAYSNNQFLKDIFQACMMYGVDYLFIAVRNTYRKHKDFDAIYNFLETLYINGRLKLPLKGIILVGY